MVHQVLNQLHASYINIDRGGIMCENVFIMYDEQKNVIGVFGYEPEQPFITITQEEWTNYHHYKKEDLKISDDGKLFVSDDCARIFSAGVEIQKYKKYLASTDWVEPFLIKHYLNLEPLDLNSDKFKIEKNRKEAREFIKNNS